MMQSRTARIRALAQHDVGEAQRALAALLGDLFAMAPGNVRINVDKYSLNSLNGFFDSEGQAYFFKFHQEEREEGMTGEYYRAEILSRAGLPVDQPVHMSAQPGEQILVYRRRTDPRFSDVLFALDTEDDAGKRREAVRAERNLSARLLEVYLETLHPVTVAEVSAEPIHRLFYERMIDADTRLSPGGRLADFYVGKPFVFPGMELDWDRFSRLKFVINGQLYKSSIGELFDAAAARLRPDRLADAGGVVAHGDAHNANVWYTEEAGRAELSFFDPAFAGSHIPTLLAEVKATFHNIFAHPFWLYDPAIATETFRAQARLEGNLLHVDTDWDLSPVRRDLLEVKATALWRPLLLELKRRGMLPADWRAVLRSGLFLSPTLVMNLRAGARSHTPASSLIAFSVAIMVGSEPDGGADLVTDFLDLIDPESASG
ncbi:MULTISPECIES: hypothetical protein [Mesorhizobium]|uniref:Aminoglycoside phosphotransferase domain-containing protein n=2 Tax=Mesorhizobium TaxID=68287 RepID=A0A1A5JF77_RHILI|nr:MULTISPECIES: hypothetical protein [Mesorhizobium]ETA71621.1 hypothetical protein MesloDRAFT_0472 [Mesorhizobium japonicum R7A]MBE1708459.1 hypothetical protein [Mesorhizobium japonicum]MBE1713628.1 hypothetical protein [Mesorhizobium japonicum]MUT19778.1 hypothetical protein [Mesorhizobium japonicum]MUT25748.1 hypothetical protein [Mesorhizobium japonicum]